jgi:hypothetical protein
MIKNHFFCSSLRQLSVSIFSESATSSTHDVVKHEADSSSSNSSNVDTNKENGQPSNIGTHKPTLSGLFSNFSKFKRPLPNTWGMWIELGNHFFKTLFVF